MNTKSDMVFFITPENDQEHITLVLLSEWVDVMASKEELLQEIEYCLNHLEQIMKTLTGLNLTAEQFEQNLNDIKETATIMILEDVRVFLDIFSDYEVE